MRVGFGDLEAVRFTVTLRAALDVPGALTLIGGQLTITDDLTITGPGAERAASLAAIGDGGANNPSLVAWRGGSGRPTRSGPGASPTDSRPCTSVPRGLELGLWRPTPPTFTPGAGLQFATMKPWVRATRAG